MSFTPSPSAGRGPLGTFRLPRNPHAPIRPSRLSESHLIKPYASFEGDESSSSRSSIPKDVLGDAAGHAAQEDNNEQAEQFDSPSVKEHMDMEDEERMTDDFDFGDDEFLVDVDIGEAQEADSILDATATDFGLPPLTQQERGPQIRQGTREGLGKGKGPANRNGGGEDEILDTDIPGLALFDGRKLSSDYQFTFADPRRDGEDAQTASASGDTPRRKSREDRKREREEERDRRNATRALLHPHDALRSITPDVDVESRSSSRASSVDGQDGTRSPYHENHTSHSPMTASSHSGNYTRRPQDGHRTPSPSMLPPRDPRLKLFQFHYDTFTRDHLSALVDSIAVGSVGSSPSLQVCLILCQFLF
jgi:hypothetical protein